MNNLHHIEEPKLIFGYGQQAYDPRDGLTLFGAYSRDKFTNPSIGVVGTDISRARVLNWLKSIIQPVYGSKQDIARPYFPSIETVFGMTLNFKAIKEVSIDSNMLNLYLNYKDSYQRVHNLANLYADAIKTYNKDENEPVTFWIVVIPDEVYKYGRPKSNIPKSELNIKVGLTDSYSRQNLSLFPEVNDLQLAYQYKINFHNQLKAKLLSDKIITQIVRESTIAYSDFRNSKDKPVRDLEKFESAIAWNLATAFYYKAGGTPWILNAARPKVCYLGLVYKQVDPDKDKKTACCAAQMFLNTGDGLVFKGNIGPWYNETTSEYHLLKDDAKDLLQKALATFYKKDGCFPEEIFIHSKTFFEDEEWNGFLEAADNKTKVIGVRIRPESIFKLYRTKVYPVPRGTVYFYNNSKAYLWTKGFVPRIQTQFGLETPNPLSVAITRGEQDIKTVCEDILALTKLNYNACIYGDGIPVTLRFANAIGEVLTSGPLGNIEVLPFKHYV
jgi:hypothetical protein